MGLDRHYKRNVCFMTANAKLSAGALEVFMYIAATVPGILLTVL